MQGLGISVQGEAGLEASTMMDLCISAWPFMLGTVIVIMLLMAFPDLALWFSKLMQGRRSVRRTRH